MFTANLKEYEASPEKYDLSSLRTGFMAGSVCPPPLIKRVIEDLGMEGLTIIFGMTELSCLATLMKPGDSLDKKMTTTGPVGPHTEIKIVDNEGRMVPQGVQGEILLRGYLVMKEYWEDPEKTAKDKDVGGWLHSGDLGQLDEDGYLQITGRSKDLIIRGGENIAPGEIEEIFLSHPEVRDVQCIGVEDEYFGEEVTVWINGHDLSKGSP